MELELEEVVEVEAEVEMEVAVLVMRKDDPRDVRERGEDGLWRTESW